MTNYTLKSIVLTLIAILTISVFTSCSSEPEEPCSIMVSLKNELEKKSDEMISSWTPWGARSDFNDMVKIWDKIIRHARGCKQCKKWIKKNDGMTIDELDTAMRKRFRETERQLNQLDNTFIENFIKGFMIGSGLL